jgi:enoyl-CoA hydratase/carnithine racemase
VLTITLDRPEAMNALSPDMMAGLENALIAFRDDPALSVAIVTGTGPKAFCAGADLGKLGNPSFRVERRLELFTGLSVMKPIVAAVNGHCLAGGLGLALLADVRVASENATFGCMGTARGIIPGAGQTARLAPVVGLTNAMWLLLSAERIDAAEAHRIGLVNRVVAPDQLMTAAREMATTLASRAPLALQGTKRATLESVGMATLDALRNENELARPIMSSEDASEGIRAFNEKRPPVWKGR